MWRTIYDDKGKVIQGADTDFYNAVKKSNTLYSKLEFLDTDFNVVDDGIVTSNGVVTGNGQFQNLVSSGSIDIDRSRGTRRTAEFTILNPTAEFTPALHDFEEEGDWVGKIYLNRIIRAWRGFRFGERKMFIPVGTFMIDICDVLVEQNMSLVNLTCSDQWKKLAKSYAGRDITYEKGVTYNSIITDLASDSGIPTTGKMRMVIDSLSDRDVADRKTGVKVKIKEGDSRGDKLKELADKWGIDAYFDPMGVFKTEDMKSDRSRKTEWRFASEETDVDGRHGGLISIRRSFNDDNLYNHAIIIGTGGANDNNNNTPKVVRVSRRDDDPKSKTSIDRIGDRVYLFSSDKISTVAEANRALNRAWRLRFQLSEEIEANVIVNPGLEANDFVSFYEPVYAKLDGRYRLAAFDIPFVTGRQRLRAVNIIRGEDL